MIANLDTPEVQISGGASLARIDMGDMDAESIRFMLLQSRDGFYSNKELAPIREYSTNARDAHIEAGCPNRPIEVTLPSQLSPEFRVRDFGKGITFENLCDIYFKYWKSTKRDSNDTNGCLGIGAKAAMAYTDAYTVVSIVNGEKIVANGNKSGFADILCRQPKAEGEEDGIEVIIPVQQKDIQKFITEALNFFKYWDVRPIFHNIEQDKLIEAFNIMDAAPFLSGNGWAVRPSGFGKGDTKAVMSSVSYSIDWAQVRNSMPPEISNKVNGIYQFLEENLTTFYFANGTLCFTPNRETLQYNDVTVNSIATKLVEIFDSLLNLITSKIADAPNIWEAKIRYNRIFRKELDGFEKTDTFGGSLSTVENLLKSRIQWNGINISDGYFDDLNNWDANEGNVGSNHDDAYIPLLQVYVKDDARTGVKVMKTSRRRRWSNENNKIICSPKSVVVIQDTEKNAWAKSLAQYFLYKSTNPASQVYVLNLSKSDVKADFFKEYNFETVPVSYVSSNETLIKAYVKSIRKPRTDSGIDKAGSRPLNCPSMAISNRKHSGYVAHPYWTTESVNAKGIDGEGLYYVVYNKDCFAFNGRNIYHSDCQDFWQAIYELAKLAGVKLEKVYGIYQRSADSVWFKEAVEDGNWINLAEFVKENADCLEKDEIKKARAYLNSQKNVGIKTSETLLPLLANKDGVAGKLFNQLVEVKKCLEVNRTIPFHLGLDGFEHEQADVDVFNSANESMTQKYPMLSYTGSFMNDSYGFDDSVAKTFADYINMIDGQTA